MTSLAPDRPGAAHGTPAAARTRCAGSIDVATGEVLLDAADAELPGLLPLVLRRTHVTGLLIGERFGSSWLSTVDQRVLVDEDGVRVALDDGRLLGYPVPDGDEPVRPVAGSGPPLHRTPDGWRLAGPHTDLHFTADGGLRRVADRCGNAFELLHDDTGTLTELAHTGGYRLLVTTEDGLVTALEPAGTGTPALRYRYDGDRRLVEVVTGDTATGYDYDDAGRIVRRSDDTGDWYAYRYDEHGRCVAGRGAGGHRDVTLEFRDGPVTAVTDSLGHTTEYRCDEHGRVAVRTDPLGGRTEREWDGERLTGVTDPLGHRTGYRHDAAGNLVEVTHPDGGRTLSTYDAAGRCTSTTGPDGAIRRWEYDERGWLRAETDPAGAVTRYDYGETGALTAVTDALGCVTRFQHNAAGLPVAVIDALGGVTRYRYDETGRLRETVDPVGLVTRRSWTATGEPAERVDPDGAVWRWERPEPGVVDEVAPDGARTRTEHGPGGPVAVTGPDGATVRFGYDTELRVTSVTEPGGLTWRYEYDPAGRPVAEIDPDGRARRYTRDAAGHVVERTTPGGASVALDRDECGRVVRRTGPDGEAVYGYDRAGRLTLARNADAEVRIGYDRCGRVVSETTNRRAVTGEYDRLGRRVRLRTQAGGESTWRYDALHRPVELHSAGHTVAFGWDAAGRPVSRDLGRAVLRQDFDAAHRLTGQSLRAGDRPLQQRDYRYAPDGRLSDSDDALSGPRHLIRDAAGRVHTVRGNGWQERYSYDAAGRPTAAEWPAPDAPALGPRRHDGTLLVAAGAIEYTHDAEGRVVTRVAPGPDGTPETVLYHWNADSQLIGVSTPDGREWRYAYDALGRRISKQRLDGEGRVLEQVEYGWDGGRLVERLHGGPGLRVLVVTWDWEPDGSRAVSQVERPLDGDETRFLAVVTDVDGGPAELVDAQGNLVWHGLRSWWGTLLSGRGSGYTPLRSPGYYQDPETGLHHTLTCYHDPETNRPLTPQPPPGAPTADADPEPRFTER